MDDKARVLLLVVESRAQRAQLNQLFSDTPHHLVFAVDGQEGYDRYAEVKPDLVAAHLHAERIDGGALCRLVRQQLGGSQVPFVLTGDAAHAAAGLDRMAEVDADLFLSLPITEGALKEQLFTLLALGRHSTDVKGRPVGSVEPETAASAPTDATQRLLDAAPAAVAEAEQATEAQPFESTQSLYDLAAGSPPTLANDMDTVVSFKNPFFEPGSGFSVPDVSAPDVEEHVTQVAIEAPPVGDAGGSTPGAPGGSVSEAAEVSSSPRGATPDPLEEPRISPSATPFDQPSTDSQLIAEVPRERTPTGDSDERHAPTGGTRRGLDESQLGKRLAKRVRAMYRLLERADHYELLGVPRDAEFPAIQQAYYELSLEFHPDRFFLLRSGDLKEKIYAIYRQVAEAFRLLGDDDKRAAYDASSDRANATPAAGRTPAEAPPLAAAPRTDAGQRYLELAQRAFSAGDLNHARLMLSLASAVERDNASLRDALRRVVRATAPSL